MDPDEALQVIRRLCAAFDAGSANAADGEDLAQHVAVLDEWLSKGGFLPEGWMAHRVSAAVVEGVREGLLDLARAHRSVIPPSAVVATSCAGMARMLSVS